jgi:uncharacterized transporter YbjL
MSWQCPYCETVNQDVVPLCTVCDRLAPVIESYLSLEKIEHANQYTTLLSQIKDFERIEDTNQAIQTALDAIAIYEDNDVAVSKLKENIKAEVDNKISLTISELLHAAVESEDYVTANCIIELCDRSMLSIPTINEYRAKVTEAKAYSERISAITTEVFNLAIDLKQREALELLDKALLSYPTDEQLLSQREKIQQFIEGIEKYRKPTPIIGKKFPKPQISNPKVDVCDTPSGESGTDSIIQHKRKFPKVKRKTK